MPADAALLLVILGAANHQVTHIMTTGVIFEDFRQWVARRFGPDSKPAYLTRCHLCAGTWVGFVQAAAVTGAVQIVGTPVTDFVLVAFTVALLGRVWNEALALASSKVSAIRAATDAQQAATTAEEATTMREKGALIAKGHDRHVYEYGPDAVLKVDMRRTNPMNQYELELWERIRDTPDSRYFAPILDVLPDGSLVMPKADYILGDRYGENLAAADPALAALEAKYQIMPDMWDVGVFAGQQKFVRYADWQD